MIQLLNPPKSRKCQRPKLYKVMNKQILIVDDEIEIVKILNRSLSRNGYTTFTAYSLNEAKNIFSENKVDIILLDINLPDGSGLEELPHFKTEQKNCSVILMSALDSKDIRMKALEKGALNFVSKPFSMQSISHMIENIK